MSVENTIFRGLASKDGENTTTELLANLLKYKCLRDIFFTSICSQIQESGPENAKKLFDKIKPQDIKTQVIFPKTNTQKKSIPDILIENTDCFIIFESKIKKSTELQTTQIEDYPNLFKDKAQTLKKYIFLLPCNYNSSEINKIDKNICVKVDWSKILSDFYKSDIEKIAPVVNEALSYLKSVIEIENTNELSDVQPLYKIALEYDWNKLKEEKEKIEKIAQKIVRCKNKIIERYRKFLNPSDDIPCNAYQFGSTISLQADSTKKRTNGIWLGCSPCYFSDDNEKRFAIQLSLRQDCVKFTDKPKQFYDFHDGWYYFDFSSQKEEYIVNETINFLEIYYKDFPKGAC